MWSPFYVKFATKNSKAHCDVALLLMVVICGVRLIGRLPYHLHLSRPLNLHQIPFTSSATRLTDTNWAPILDVAQQPMWRNIKYRHRHCDGTWSFATNLKKIFFFVSISSGISPVVIATVAAFDVSPHGLSCNITLRCRVFGSVCHVLKDSTFLWN